MHKTAFYLLVILIWCAIVSCTKSSSSTPPPDNCGTPGTLFLAVRSVLQANCAVSGCHVGSSAQSGLDLSNNCVIVAQKAQIKLRAVDNAGTSSQMPAPPLPPLSLSDRQKILDWINAGGRITD